MVIKKSTANADTLGAHHNLVCYTGFLSLLIIVKVLVLSLVHGDAVVRRPGK